MRIKIIITAILLCLFIFSGCVKNYEVTQNSSIDENKSKTVKLQDSSNLETDEVTAERLKILDTISSLLLQRLEFKFTHDEITKDEFLIYKNEVEERIYKIKNDLEFVCEMQYLVSKFKDVHTYIGIDYEKFGFEKVKTIPFAIERFDDKYRIVEVIDEYKEYLGYNLIEINGVKISEIKDKLDNIQSNENKYISESNFIDNITMIHNLSYINIADFDSSNVVLSLQSDNTDIIKINYPVILMSDIKKINIEKRDKQSKYYDQNNYSSLKIDNNTYLIRINRCEEDKNYMLAEFEKQISTDMEINNFNKVIIDLRYNPGGTAKFDNMINILKKYQEKDNFEVYTLISNRTCSLGVVTAMLINQNLKNTIVGTPTGNKANFNAYGSRRYFLGGYLVFAYSAKYVVTCPYDDMMAVYPDITIEETYDNYMNGVDTVFEAVLNM